MCSGCWQGGSTLFTALLIVSLFLLLLSVLPQWRNPHWVFRGGEFGRVTLLWLLAISLALQVPWLLAGNFAAAGLAVATALCIALHVWHLRQYQSLWRCEVVDAPAQPAGDEVSVLLANVQMENRASSKLLALVKKHQPDVLVTLETDQWWQSRLDVLESSMPHAMKCPLDNRYGMHVYSRLALEDRSTSHLVEEAVPSFHAALVLPSGARVRLHVMHPAPPSPTENARSSERDAELLVVARQLEREAGPTLVVGDFNDVPWSRTAHLLRRVSGLLDPRIGRGMFNTFHARIPLLRWPLDQVYCSEHFALSKLQRLPAIGSDHFPLLIRLALVAPDILTTGARATGAQKDEARALTAAGGVSVDDVPEPPCS
jgi:endonuclease/exonuclease/phosphatase (EEP) superfamily protein YafD